MSRQDFSFCLIPGWAENRWKSHLLLYDLASAGGRIVEDVKTAEVVIAHSAGGHFAAGDFNAKSVIIIGPIYGFDKPLIIMVAQEWVYDSIYYLRNRLFKAWLAKNAYYLAFAFRHPIRTVRTYLAVRRPFDLSALAGHKVLIIRNSRDHFCSPKIEQDAKAFKNITYAGLPGIHDDLWINPAPYVDLILKHL